MIADTQLQVPIDSQSAIFTDHLTDPFNERIIFSGIFGIGKSYFIEKFFNIKEDKYLAIKLAPVNYSISSNEDIFNLIKYDILYELIINHKLELESEIIERHIAYGTVLSSNAGSLLEDFLSVAPSLNKSLGGAEDLINPSAFISFLKKVIPQIEKIERQRKDANLNQRVLDFIKRQEKSTLFESDFITGFIIDSLNRLANKEGQERLKVLVIDDLDRIDPEHIFRLFNIFSSHLSYGKSTNNKFGFDKVIFVCDIENIRNIFSARYGTNTDFSGYIDKFYSTDVFYFDNSSAVVSFTDKIVSRIKFSDNTSYAEAFLQSPIYGDNALLSFFVRAAINSGALSLRKIKSIITRTYSIDVHTLPLKHKQQVSNINFPGVVALEVMTKFYGGVIPLRKALQKISSFKKSRHTSVINYPQSINDLNVLRFFIPILDYKQHHFDANQNRDRTSTLVYTFKGYEIKYELKTFSETSNHYYAKIFQHNDVNYSFLVIDIIIETLDHLVDIGYM